MILSFVFIYILPLFEDPQPTVIYLVRHAEKRTDQADPDLNDQGKRRVSFLLNLFDKLPLDRVVSSEYKRTVQTAAPIAADHEIDHEVIPASTPDQFVASLKEGQTVLVVGHSNTIPELIQRLGCPCDPIDDQDYDGVFIVIISEPICTLNELRLSLP